MRDALVVLSQHRALHNVLPFTAAAAPRAAVDIVVDAQRVADACGISEARGANGASIRLRATGGLR